VIAVLLLKIRSMLAAEAERWTMKKFYSYCPPHFFSLRSLMQQQLLIC